MDQRLQGSNLRPQDRPWTHLNYATYQPYLQGRPPETLANIALCLIHQANYLLDRQIKVAEADFQQNGGIRERMTKARLNHRDRKH